MAPISSSVTAPDEFQSEARDAVAGIQRALAHLVDEVLPSPERRLRDISESLRIDTKLAWKLSRILELNDPFAAGLYVPGASAYRIIQRAAVEHGASAQTVDALQRSFERFETLQSEHAGSRRTLDVLLSGLAEEEQDRLDLSQRKAAFQANASVWGVSAAMRLMAFVIRPAPHDTARIEVAHVAGLFGVTRTRLNVPWRVAHLRAQNSAGKRPSPRLSSPVDPAVGPGQPPLLRAFTSPEAPGLVPVARPGGDVEYRLGPGPIGRRSRFDLVLAEHLPDAGHRYRSGDDLQLSVASRNRTPVESVVLDMIVDRELYGPINPEAFLVSELWGECSPTDRDDPERLPLFERPSRVGAGLRAFRHPRVPRHEAMMAHVFESVGWAPDRFETYRIELEYPPAPTNLRLVHPLPPAP